MTSRSTFSPTTLAPRPLSRLTYKIMSFNLLAVIILIIGIGYLDRYREGLTTAEMETLAAETQLYAAVLGESSFPQGRFNGDGALNLLESFTEQKKQQIHLIAPDRTILAHIKTSGLIEPKSGDKDRTRLPGAVGAYVEKAFANFVDIFSLRFNLPLFPASTTEEYGLLPDVGKALQGEVSLSAWKDGGGALILSSSAPIMKGSDPVGIVLVTRTDTTIENTFANTRLDILRLFLIALTATASLSLYISGVIGHPLRQLASAAEAIREGKRGVIIPDLSMRDDEIGELSLAMRQMTKALNDRLDSIDRFAADVSHELKNPLTSMRSAIETLPRVKSDNDRLRLTEIILHDLQRMDRLISDISQASRLDIELYRDVLTPVDLRDVLLPMIDSYRQPLERSADGDTLGNSDNIHFTGLSSPVMVMGNEQKLAQVFHNLIGNALSFSPENHPVRIAVEAGSDFVTVTVEDDGPGIPDSKLEKIFERFYSERPASEAFGTHSGLGLSIAKQIVDAHGGAIYARNRTDENGQVLGARFVTRLKTPRSER